MQGLMPFMQVHSFQSTPLRTFLQILGGSQVSALLLVCLHAFVPFGSASLSDPRLMWFSITLPAVIVGALLSFLTPPVTIVVTDQEVRGPGFWGRTTVIPLAAVDVSATRAQPLWRRLSGASTIYGRDGSRLHLNRFLLGKANVRSILALVGCTDTPAA
jgi:hypothetical protein